MLLAVIIFAIKSTAFNCYFKDLEPASVGRKTPVTEKAYCNLMNLMGENDFIQRMSRFLFGVKRSLTQIGQIRQWVSEFPNPVGHQ